MKFLPFTSSVCSIFFNKQTQAATEARPVEEEQQQKLISVLDAWGLQRHPIPGEGNCCFSSVAFALITNHDVLMQHNSSFFTSKKLVTTDVDVLSKTLRELAVKEWRENEDEYQGCLVHSNVSEEAEHFLQCGYFEGELGDTMVLALSNALGLPIIVFSSIPNHRFISIFPRQVNISFPIYLAYTHCGPGHYDGVVMKTDTSCTASDSHETHTKPQYCTCGKK